MAKKVVVDEQEPAEAAEATGEYPKRLYGKGRLERTVVDEADHKKWEAKGYKAEPSEAHLHDLGVEV
jgi:hypothetical protein